MRVRELPGHRVAVNFPLRYPRSRGRDIRLEGPMLRSIGLLAQLLGG